MPLFRDQLGFSLELEKTPVRIVSLVPSQTQLLYDLGLREEVVGITKFCIHPDEWFRMKTRVGGTKKVAIDKVRALQPDLIIGNKEENEQADIEALKKIAPVWMSDIYDLPDAMEMIHSVGEICGRRQEAREINETISKAFTQLEQNVANQQQKKKVLYCIWNDPFMVVGKRTFIDDMLSRCGFSNAMNEERYPVVKKFDQNPDLVLLSSEPFPFGEKHLGLFRERYPGAQIHVVDGEAFSWYGSKLRESPGYFCQFLNELTD